MKEGHGPLFLNPTGGREPQPLLHKIRDTTYQFTSFRISVHTRIDQMLFIVQTVQKSTGALAIIQRWPIPLAIHRFHACHTKRSFSSRDGFHTVRYPKHSTERSQNSA